MPSAALAAAVTVVGHLLGWKGVDLAAQVYRADAFRRRGFELWDFRWYGGHWTPDYSLLYPPLAAGAGVAVLAVVSAAVAALAFDRLAVPAWGRPGRVASVVFALGTAVPAAIGQLPFLTGGAIGLSALWAARRDADHGWRRALSAAAIGLMAAAAAATSPLAGLFVGLSALAWLVGGRRGARPWLPAVALGAGAAAPVLVCSWLFPGDGPMPYPASDYAWELTVAVGVALLAGRRHRAVAAGAVLLAVTASASELIASPLGGNVGRLEDVAAWPLAVALAYEGVPALLGSARWLRVAAMAAVSIPLALSQWAPAWGAMTAAPSNPATRAAYFAPLDRQLLRLGLSGPAGRVEVVPTAYHWEADYVAAVMPLARGWERQLDVADNPIFYRPGPLDPAAYRRWLLDNGVRFVALAATPADPAGRAEAALIASGRVPGLTLVWESADWRLYAVVGSTGLISGAARLVEAGGDHLVIDAWRPGPVIVRVRPVGDWRLTAGRGCIGRTAGPWVLLRAGAAGRLTLTVDPLASGGSPVCRSDDGPAP